MGKDTDDEREREDEELRHVFMPAPDFTDYEFDYSPAAGRFLNFVIEKFSLPWSDFVDQVEDDEDMMLENLTDHLFEEAYDNSVEYIEQQRQSLVIGGEEKLYERYDELVKGIRTILEKRVHFGDYRKNKNNKLVLLFKKFRVIGPDERLNRFCNERRRIIELPFKQEAVSQWIHDDRLGLAEAKEELMETLEGLRAFEEDTSAGDFVYKDTPNDQRGGYPRPKRPFALSAYDWRNWDGTALH